MSSYQNDRVFTDYIFKNLAVPIIYPQLGWQEKFINPADLNNMDIHQGIDAIALDFNFNEIGVQYRFRDSKYGSYNDMTFRYKREYNCNIERILSEFFKIKADYFLYGIPNGQNNVYNLQSNTGFIKWVVVDIARLFSILHQGRIIIDGSSPSKVCQFINGVMICPINHNVDNSSSFVPFDISMLRMFDNNIVVAAYNF